MKTSTIVQQLKKRLQLGLAMVLCTGIAQSSRSIIHLSWLEPVFMKYNIQFLYNLGKFSKWKIFLTQLEWMDRIWIVTIRARKHFYVYSLSSQIYIVLLKISKHLRWGDSFFNCLGFVAVCQSFSSCGIRASLPHGMRDFNSLTRDQTHITCIGKQILNHWTTREVLWRLFY